MSTLIIRDLARHNEMGRNEMAAVRGGTGFGFPVFDASSFKLSNSTQQLANQAQNTMINTGDNNAFTKHIDSYSKPIQTADNHNETSVYSPMGRVQ
jgi:hypothetical protein